MSGSRWTVIATDILDDQLSIKIDPPSGVWIKTNGGEEVLLTPAQSATLRAALEAAELELS